MADSGRNFSIRRWMDPNLQNQRNSVTDTLLAVALNQNPDKPNQEYLQ
jgi:hypothetical protein